VTVARRCCISNKAEQNRRSECRCLSTAHSAHDSRGKISCGIMLAGVEQAGGRTSKHCTLPTLYLDSSPSSKLGLTLQRDCHIDATERNASTIHNNAAMLMPMKAKHCLQPGVLPVRRRGSIHNRTKVHLEAHAQQAAAADPGTLFAREQALVSAAAASRRRHTRVQQKKSQKRLH
jgi:hypothetical protein